MSAQPELDVVLARHVHNLERRVDGLEAAVGELRVARERAAEREVELRRWLRNHLTIIAALCLAVVVLGLSGCASTRVAGPELERLPGLVIVVSNPFDCDVDTRMVCVERSALKHECRCTR